MTVLTPSVLVPSNFRLRALQASDVELLAKSDDDRSFFERVVERCDWSDKKIRVLVAEVQRSEDGQKDVVGCAYVGLGYPNYYAPLSEDIGQLYIAHLDIKEPFRRHGYGTAVLASLKEEAQKLGLHVVRAECEKGWRVDFYGRVGFEPVPYKGPRDDYPTDAHQMLELWLKVPEPQQ
ncbi:hypothetical protein P43SY_006149 [Pythium insidiosum]|uniref:N-acetyltransferase domain-containing protein n=1 Tax=Pythium insidiosum TaxID=114742 RepID=A0AAD5LHX6_PYTIN|nr:hypothetical protein P43SY_006149 [Pythium insidiosum]